MIFTDDPVADAERHYAEQEEKLNKLPKCCYCGNPIQQEFAIYINDEWYCDDCLETHFRKEVEDY